MSFALNEVKSIARAVALEHRRGIEIVAVTRSEGGADSAEILVKAPRAALVSIPVARGGSESDLRWSIADGLCRHFGGALAS
jgi:hypothetical protein